MKSFNNIVLGDLDTSSQETEGSVFVGGDYRGTANINPRSQADVNIGPVSGTFVVGGSVYGSPSLKSGNAVIGGSVNGTIVNNGAGSVSTGISGIPVDQVRTVLKSASLELAGWASTPGGVAHTGDQNNLYFQSTPDAHNIAVFNVDGAWLRNGTFKGIYSDPGVTTIINVSGTNITIAANGNDTNSNVIFNFYEAATLNIQTAFNYSILAPLATVTQSGGGINGTVVSGRLYQGSEIRPDNFAGTFAFPPSGSVDAPSVPLPAPALLLLGGLGALGALRRRRAA